MPSTLFDLTNKTAIITGGARGLGFAMAKALASHGARIALFDILTPVADLSGLRAEGIEVDYWKVDVTSKEDLEKAVDEVKAKWGSLDVVVCAAGVARDSPFLETSIETFEFQHKINTLGSYLTAQVAASRMDPSLGGSIIFIATLTSHQAAPAQRISAYAASKGAIRSLVPHLAMELAPLNIRVNSISPGYMMTDMVRGLEKKSVEEGKGSLVETFGKEGMLGRMGREEEVGGPVVFLASGAGSYVTGQDILVDGGVSKW